MSDIANLVEKSVSTTYPLTSDVVASTYLSPDYGSRGHPEPQARVDQQVDE